MTIQDQIVQRLRDAGVALQRTVAERDALLNERHEPIAIIGIGCRLPGGADSPEAFWRMLDGGRDAIGPLDARWALLGDAPGEHAPRWAGVLTGAIDEFDAGFFGISAREARTLDPQQRLLLEVTWEAFEDAGIALRTHDGRRTGVFLGACSTDYGDAVARQAEQDAYSTTGNMRSVAAGRVSYTFGFGGPCVMLDTACSSSLVALHLACRSLRSSETDLAVVGGVNMLLSPATMDGLARTQALSPDGRCRTFDAAANGYVRGEGCGLVLLKRLSAAERDGDRIWAVVRGSAVNQDGKSTGLTAPNVLAQEALLREALRDARVEARAIGFVETHGTGTSLGDPIEVEALRAVIGGPRADGSACWLGAVKTNVGHLEGGAGVVGVIKAALALDRERIPRNLHFRTLNPRIRLDGTALKLASEPVAWPRGAAPRLAGVSSFGISGTNAHAILEEAPRRKPVAVATEAGAKAALVVVSGKTVAAVRAQCARLAEIDGDVGVGAIAYSQATSRSALDARVGVVATTIDELRAGLRAVADGGGEVREVGRTRGKLAFVFAGQGSQVAGMGRGLYADWPVFRDAFDRVIALFGDLPLLDVMWSTADGDADGSRDATRGGVNAPALPVHPLEGDKRESPLSMINQTGYTQPAVFAIEYALAALWRSWGVAPAIVAGHSIGELVAACVAGVFSLADAVKLVGARAKLMQALPAGGAMASIAAAEADVAAGLARELSIAAVNGPAQVTIAGPAAAVTAACAAWTARGVRTRPLAVSHAFHSAQMDAMLEAFAAVARSITYSAPALPVVSNLSGALAGAEIATAAYWVRHVREAVRFADGMRALDAAGVTTFVELGGRPTLLGAIRDSVGDQAVLVASLRPGRDDTASLLDGLGAYWATGGDVAWRAVFGDGAARVALPTYAWQRERYWLEAGAARGGHGEPTRHPLLGVRVAAAGRSAVFETVLGPREPAWLVDHRVEGRVVVPGAAIAELMRAAGCEVVGDDAWVRGLVLQAPLVIDGQMRVQVVVEDGEATLYSQPATSRASDAWLVHATATIAGERATGVAVVDVDAVRARCGEVLDVGELYARFERIGLAYGPTFRGLVQLWRGRGEVLAELAPVASAIGAGYGVAPMTLDAAMQAMIGVLEHGDALALPFEIGALVVHVAGGAVAWAHVQASGDGAADVRLLDRGGMCVAELRGVLLRRVASASAAAAKASDGLYELAWHAQPATAASAANATVTGRWLVVGAATAWRAEIAAVLAGSEASVDDFASRLDGVAGVVYVAESLADEAVPAAALRVATAGLQVTQALAAHATPVRVRWVTRGAVAVSAGELRDARGVAMATLWGFGRTVAHEHPELDARLIDVEAASDVACELASGDDEDQIAWRAGTRYAARLVRAADNAPDAPVAATVDGTVVVTGGLGALGLHVARWLAAHGARHVVLVSRRGADTPGAADAIAQLAALGIEVSAPAVDVTDRAALAAMLAEIPDLRGVIHAAGVVDDGVIREQDAAQLARAIDPKLAGAWNLHELTAGRELAYFVMFSSASGLFGAAGQSNYAAANTALDALAAHRRAHGLPAHSLQWGAWSDAGMAARMSSALEARLLRQGIGAWSAADGVARMGAAIARDEAQLAVLRVDLPAVRRRFNADVPPVWRALIAPPARTATPAAADSSWAAQVASLSADKRLDAVRALVSGEIARVLSLRGGVPAAQPLAELGMDSLMAVELRNALGRRVGRTLPASLAFDYPTVDALTQWLASTLVPADPAAPAATTRRARHADEPIAIVGFGCRYPGGITDAASYWKVLSEQIDAVSEMPGRWDHDALYDPDPDAIGKMTTRHGGFVADIERFDANFFGISPREAEAMDPQQRLLLETTWEALEHGGIVPERLAGSDTGVFVGLMYQEYAALGGGLESLDGYVTTGSLGSVASGRLSYVLGLKGPSLTVDTACSSSLVTVHLACQALRQGECSVALAGGVALMLTPQVFVEFSRLRGLSADGRCKSFGAGADGVGWAEGCGMLVLKRLSDAERDGDRVLALIRGSAVNQDGRSNGLTAPNGPSQQAVIEQALRAAGVRPSDVDYVECHGTGTRLGDPIEVQALGAALAAGRTSPVVIGSVKSNLGHTQAAAGAAGIMKVALALAHEQIPASLHAAELSPHIAWSELPVQVATQATAWPRGSRPRIAGVSSFGISGTNAHVILEEPPVQRASNGVHASNDVHASNGVHAATPTVAGDPRDATRGGAPGPALPVQGGRESPPSIDRAELVIISAKTEAALRAQCARLAGDLPAHPLSPIAYSLATTRGAHDHRLALVVRSRDQLADQLAAAADGGLPPGATRGERAASGKLAFVFSGQGSQVLGMGRALYAKWPVFRAALDDVLARFTELPLRDVMWAAPGDGADGETGPRDATRGGVNAPVLPVHPLEGDKRESPLSSDQTGPRDATRGGVNAPALPVQRGRESPLSIDETGPRDATRGGVNAPALPVHPLEGDKRESPLSIDQTGYTQPALFAVEYALAALWRSWGVEPAIVAGHSIGELVAACVAGVFSLEDAVKLVGARARLMQALPAGGAMATIAAAEADVAASLSPELSIAAINGPAQVTIAGPAGDVAAASAAWAARGVRTRQLAVSHAFHSAQMDGMLDAFAQVAATVRYRAPAIPVISNVSGAIAGPELATADYWVRHVRQAVRFADGVRALHAVGVTTFVEVGARATLLSLVAASLEGEDGEAPVLVSSLRGDRPETAAMLEGLGACWAHGGDVAWAGVFPDGGERVSLPLYAWQLQRYWKVAPPARAGEASIEAALRALAGDGSLSAAARAALPELIAALGARATATTAGDPIAPWLHAVAWREVARPSLPDIVPAGRWVVVGEDMHARTAFATALTTAQATAIAVSDATGLGMVLARQASVRGVVAVVPARAPEAFALAILQALAAPGAPPVWLATRGAVGAAAGEAPATPAHAIVWGLGRSFALEQPASWGGLIDLPATGGEADAAAWLISGSDEDQVAVRDGQTFVPRLVGHPLARGGRFGTAGTALVTGGLGGIGLHVARWLAGNGVRDLLLVGRRGMATAGADAAVDELTRLGARVRVAAADAGDRAALAAAIGDAQISAVFHVAGIVDYSAIGELTPARLAEVLAAKRDGTAALAELTAGRALDAFVCFSSIAGVWGAGGQAAYAAGNAFLDAWAIAARARGIPALSVAWGLWQDSGLATDEARAYLEQRGMRAMATARALEALDRALATDAAHLVVADVDWAKFRPVLEARRRRPLLAELGVDATAASGEPARATVATALADLRPAARASHLEDWLASEAAALLGHDNSDALSRDRGLFDLGMDSMTAVRLASRLPAELGVKVTPTMIFEQGSIAGLAERLLGMMELSPAANGASPAAPAPTAPAPTPEPAPEGDGDGDGDGLGSDDDVLQLITDSYRKVQ